MAEEVARLGVPTTVHVVPRPDRGWSLADRLRELRRVWRALSAVRAGDVIYLVRTIYRKDFIALVLDRFDLRRIPFGVLRRRQHVPQQPRRLQRLAGVTLEEVEELVPASRK
jgi:hypothetical protein